MNNLGQHREHTQNPDFNFITISVLMMAGNIMFIRYLGIVNGVLNDFDLACVLSVEMTSLVSVCTKFPWLSSHLPGQVVLILDTHNGSSSLGLAGIVNGLLARL